MAEIDNSGYATVPSESKSVANLANWAGAFVSLALLVGVGVWGYKLLVRDVSGVPVVRATEGPMRIAPETPGGRPADHQGLAVNSVAGTGVAEAPADRLMLAPKPVGLSDEDLPSSAIVLPRPVKPRDAVTEKMTLSSLDGGLVDDDTIDPIQALADKIAGTTKPLSGEKVDGTKDVQTKVAALAPLVDAGGKGGLARSLRPVPRPKNLNTVKLAPAAVTPEPSIDVDPATIPAGTRLVQFGAYDSPETARKEWDKLTVRFDEYLDGKKRVIQRAKSGGKVFYRLRAMGFEDVSDARRFCSAIVAGKSECIPVVTR